jgi:hypothetical protein
MAFSVHFHFMALSTSREHLYHRGFATSLLDTRSITIAPSDETILQRSCPVSGDVGLTAVEALTGWLVKRAMTPVQKKLARALEQAERRSK